MASRTKTKASPTQTGDLLAGVVVEEPRARNPVAKAAAPAPSQAVAIRDPNEPPPQQRTLLQICLEAATRKGITPEKVKQYLDMAREEESRKLEAQFDNLMIDARELMPVIIKDAWNPHTKSHYAKLEKVSQEVDHIARRFGFQHTYGMADSKLDDHYRVICDLVNRNGFKRRYYLDIGTDTVGAKGGGTKSGAQGTGSSVAYARRYLKTMVWDLVIAGTDTDMAKASANGGDTIGSDQYKKIADLITSTKTDMGEFCRHFKVESLSDLPAGQANKAVQLLERKAAEQ